MSLRVANFQELTHRLFHTCPLDVALRSKATCIPVPLLYNLEVLMYHQEAFQIELLCLRHRRRLPMGSLKNEKRNFN